MDYRLSPSDLTFLYGNCKHCFVLKVRYGIPQPSIPLPAIFTKIAALQKDYFSGKRTEEFSLGLPPGVVKYGEKRVRSGRLELPGCTSTCYLSGRFDIVAELDDGSFAILDFKTGSPSDEKSEMYARQLRAYALSLESPAPGALHLSPLSLLGLLYFTPDAYAQSAELRHSLNGTLRWVGVERDDEGFIGFLTEVVVLLDGTLPEPQPDTCEWCAFRAQTAGLQADQRSGGSDSGNKPSGPVCPKCSGPMQLRKGKYGSFWSCLSFPSCKATRNVE